MAEPESRPKRGRTPFVLLGAVILLLVAGGAAIFALGGGGDDDDGAAAVSTSERTEAAPATTETVVTTSAPPTTEATTTVAMVVVPRLGGSTTIDDAQQLLADAGLAGEVVLEEGPGPYGVVVGADPNSGTKVAPGSTVTLTANTPPAAMPSVVGETAASGVKTLESYGVVVTSTEIVSEDAADNTIIDQTPKPGEPFAADAQVVIAWKPVIVYLADLDTVDRDLYGSEVGQAQLNGEIYTRSVMIDPWYGDPGFVEYDLARSFTRLVGTVGPRDDVSSETVFKIEVYADGTPVFDQTLGLGQTADLDLDMTGTLRLRLQVTQLSANSGGYVVFADPRLLGAPQS